MLLLGVLQAQAAGQVAAGSFDLLETQVLTGSAASVTFSSLSTYAADYQHLQLRIAAKSTNVLNDFDNLIIRFNGDDAANYSHHRLFGSGSSVASYAGTSTTYCFGGMTTRGTTSAFGVSVLDIYDAFETTKYKTTRSLTGGTNTSQSSIVLQSGNWRNTSAITSIFLRSESSENLITGSRFSLYGIRGG